MKQSLDAIKKALTDNAAATEAALHEHVSARDEDIANLLDAENYSLFAGGKRVRPFLVNEICRMLGGDIRVSMPYACALEMIHTYSLIHDDLPCMDDDDLRRGKPTNHKVFGYATALLAGDALLTHAFATVAENGAATPEQNAKAVSVLSRSAGEFGMIGGQIMDLAGEVEQLDREHLCKLHAMKTGALMTCAAKLGAIAAGFMPDSPEAETVTEYAAKIGLAFQVIDDILDEVGDEAELGKSLRSDAERNKTTFMTYYSVDGARAYASELTADAVSAISKFEGSEILTDLAAYLLERTN